MQEQRNESLVGLVLNMAVSHLSFVVVQNLRSGTGPTRAQYGPTRRPTRASLEREVFWSEKGLRTLLLCRKPVVTLIPSFAQDVCLKRPQHRASNSKQNFIETHFKSKPSKLRSKEAHREQIRVDTVVVAKSDCLIAMRCSVFKFCV